MRLQVRPLAPLSGLRIRRCRELWCRSKTRFESGIAVAVAKAGSCSSDSSPSLGTSICHRCGPKKQKRKKKKRTLRHKGEVALARVKSLSKRVGSVPFPWPPLASACVCSWPLFSVCPSSLPGVPPAPLGRAQGLVHSKPAARPLERDRPPRDQSCHLPSPPGSTSCPVSRQRCLSLSPGTLATR